MAAIVPLARPTPTVSEVLTGRAVLGTTHSAVASLTNWSQGRGMVVVPAYRPGNTIAAAANGVYRYTVTPRYQSIQRVWVVSCLCTNKDLVSTVTLTAGSDTVTQLVVGDRELTTPIFLVENRASQSASSEVLALTIAVTGTSAVVESIACWEMPRPALALDANDNGTDMGSVAYREPIYDGVARSIGGEADAVEASITTARRCLMQWALPGTTAAATSITATSYGNVFTGTTGTTIILTRKLYRSSTTGSLSIKVYARTADTSDIGDVRFTMTSGATGTINIPTASHAAFAWFGAPLTLAADCEDMAVADGRRSTRWDEMTIEGKVTAGGDILYLASISVWEA